MALESIKAEVDALLSQLAERPHDRQELEILLRKKLGELRACGMPLPQDIVDLEAVLDQQLSAEARDRSRFHEA